MVAILDVQICFLSSKPPLVVLGLRLGCGIRGDVQEEWVLFVLLSDCSGHEKVAGCLLFLELPVWYF